MIIDKKMMEETERKLGIVWNDTRLLMQALTHSSFAHENKYQNLEHNQRLEFLGDAVLELAVSDYLYKEYPNFPEGTLTKIRAGIVCEPSLASVARTLRLGEFLLIGRGEERSGGRERPSILADALESLIGAIYLDQGMERTVEFILDKLGGVITTVVSNKGLNTDYKTQLQELVQQKSENTLVYSIIEEHGPDHSKTFMAGVSFQGVQWGSGVGRTKKEAEQEAARNALERLRDGEISLSHG